MIKILYAVQGTGNGHVARAREIIPYLQRYARVDLLLSGKESEVELGQEVSFQLPGLTLAYNKKGGVSFWATLKKNNWWQLWRDILSLPVERYDLVISDFECVSAYAARLRKVPSVGLSHQAAFMSPAVPRPKKRNHLAEWILRYYAPCNRYCGFHFAAYAKGIQPPVIRQEIRALSLSDQGHYVVYLPAIDDAQLLAMLTRISNVDWHVFSKKARKAERKKNLFIQPIENKTFLNSLAGASGVLCSAGFELPSEAMHLGKKLMVIPIKHQYEQACNAAALKKLGVPQAKKFNAKTLQLLQEWVYEGSVIHRPVTLDIDQLLRQEILAPWLNQEPVPILQTKQPYISFPSS